MYLCFLFNDPATTEIYTLSLHDALPIFCRRTPDGAASSTTSPSRASTPRARPAPGSSVCQLWPPLAVRNRPPRSEEHTSELQSRQYLVCRLLLEKKKQIHCKTITTYRLT